MLQALTSAPLLHSFSNSFAFISSKIFSNLQNLAKMKYICKESSNQFRCRHAAVNYNANFKLDQSVRRARVPAKVASTRVFDFLRRAGKGVPWIPGHVLKGETSKRNDRNETAETIETTETTETKRPKRNSRNETTETKRPKRNDRNETAENINYRKNGKY